VSGATYGSGDVLSDDGLSGGHGAATRREGRRRHRRGRTTRDAPLHPSLCPSTAYPGAPAAMLTRVLRSAPAWIHVLCFHGGFRWHDLRWTRSQTMVPSNRQWCLRLVAVHLPKIHVKGCLRLVPHHVGVVPPLRLLRVPLGIQVASPSSTSRASTRPLASR
jgi:hypothetical protein